MPGFNVSGLGSGPTNLNKPFCTYTWEAVVLPQGVLPNNIYFRDCTEPTFNVLQEKVESAAVIYKYAAQADWEDIRASFYDVPREGKRLIDAIKRWSESVWTSIDGIKFADKTIGDPLGRGSGGYKSDTRLKVTNSDESDEYTWLLTGSWPSEIKGSDLSYASSDIKIVDMTITYDFARIR